MFCHLVSPDPLRRALMLLSDSDSEPPSPAGDTDAVVPPATPPAAAAAAGHHVAVDIPDADDDVDGDGSGEDDADEETGQPQHISPVCRLLVKAVFVVYATFVAPPLVATAATRSSSFLQALLVVVPALLTLVALFMATVRVVEAEDRERAATADSQDPIEVIN